MDLANSPALQHARSVDPNGSRTIGVISKLDLVTSDVGKSVLGNREYRLEMGYIGVSTRGPSLKERMLGSTGGKTAYDGYDVGMDVLRERLVRVLESYMESSVDGLTDSVRKELEDARYHLKVEYNDRRISAESYSIR